MTHKSVISSAIQSIGFDPATNDMEVKFHNGSVAKHSVTQAQYNSLINADSIGAYYSQHFKTKKKEIVQQNNKMKK